MIGNEIGNEGAKALSEALKENTTLTKLHVGSQDERKDEEKEKRKNNECQAIKLEMKAEKW